LNDTTPLPGQSPQPLALGPFAAFRDYAAALEARGRMLRIAEMDQDRYEATAFMYRLIDRHGLDGSTAVMIDRVKIDGRWIEGPVLANPYGRWADEAITFGLEPGAHEPLALYHMVIAHIGRRMDGGGAWQRMPPRVVSRAPCKQVKRVGEAIDLTAFAFLKNNPADGGRYLNMGAVVLEHPEFGRNVGTYRCQVKGPRKLAVNPEPGQDGWRFLTDLKKRGNTRVPCAIAYVPDPITFGVASTKMAVFREDEYPIAGGLRGAPLEVVACETSALLVPAECEMIIEGEISLEHTEPEGPYGELYGYLGPRKEQNFILDVTCVTHRERPMMVNSFTGITGDMPTAPQTAANYYRYKKLIPNLRAIAAPRGVFGVMIVAIAKQMPGEGMAAGQIVSGNSGLGKVVIVVDADVNPFNATQVMQALGARWQPSPASLLIPQTQAFMPDPSQPKRGLSSKMVIDATR
jgi:4-hydroxy-3-polyprenylbenzoate decarboxylase